MPSLCPRTLAVLFATALGAAIPGAIPEAALAQDSATVASPAELAWTMIDRFGLRFAILDGAEVEMDVDTETERAFSFSSTGGGDVGVRIGARVLMAQDFQMLPFGTLDGLAAFMTDMTGVPVAPLGVSMTLGGRTLDLYGGTGTRDVDGTPVDTRMMFLLTGQPGDDGNGLMIALYSGGQGPDTAALIEAEFVTRLALADAPAPQAAPPEEPQTEDAPDPALTTPEAPQIVEQTAPDQPLAADDSTGPTPPADTAGSTPVEVAPPAVPDTTEVEHPEAVPETAPSAPDQPLVADDAGPSPPAETTAQAVTPAIPDTWERLERFGYRFALPPGGTVRRDGVEDGVMAYWVQFRTPDPAVFAEVSLRVMTPDALTAIAGDADSPAAIEALLSRFSNAAIRRTEAISPLEDVVLTHYRSLPGFDAQGHPAPRILYLIGEAPAASGLTTWALIASTGLATHEAEGFESTVLANLSGAALLPEVPADPVAVEPTPAAPELAAPQPAPVQPEAAPTAPVTAAAPPAPVPAPAPLPTRDTLTAPARAVPPPAATPPAPVAPVLIPPASDEARAWAEAERQGTPAAVLAFLETWPRGLHSREARLWLEARAIMPPTPQASPYPPMPPGK